MFDCIKHCISYTVYILTPLERLWIREGRGNSPQVDLCFIFNHRRDSERDDGYSERNIRIIRMFGTNYWRWKKINPGLYNHTTQQIWLYHRIQRSLLSFHKKNFVDLITWCGIFRLWSLKSRVSINKISKQLVGPIKKNFFASKRQAQDLDFHWKLGCADVILTGYDVIQINFNFQKILIILII